MDGVSSDLLITLSGLLFSAFSVLLDISQSSCSWVEGLYSSSEALDPQSHSWLLDFHWGLPGWDQLAARCDVTLPQLQSWCDYHLRNHCQTVETKLPCLFPRLLSLYLSLMNSASLISALSPSLSHCPFLVSPWVFLLSQVTLLWYHAQWSQTNHSHFPGSFPHCVSHSFSRHGTVSPA